MHDHNKTTDDKRCPKTDRAIRKAKKHLEAAKLEIQRAVKLSMPITTAVIIVDDIEGICDGLDALLKG